MLVEYRIAQLRIVIQGERSVAFDRLTIPGEHKGSMRRKHMCEYEFWSRDIIQTPELIQFIKYALAVGNIGGIQKVAYASWKVIRKVIYQDTRA